jgi:PAS domain-containing protein
MIEGFLSTDLLRAFEGFSLAILDFDKKEILYASKAFETVFGYQLVGSLKGKPFEDLFPQSTRIQRQKLYSEYGSNPETLPPNHGLTITCLRKDGTIFTGSMTLYSEVAAEPNRDITTFVLISELSEKRVDL